MAPARPCGQEWSWDPNTDLPDPKALLPAPRAGPPGWCPHIECFQVLEGLLQTFFLTATLQTFGVGFRES